MKLLCPICDNKLQPKMTFDNVLFLICRCGVRVDLSSWSQQEEVIKQLKIDEQQQ